MANLISEITNVVKKMDQNTGSFRQTASEQNKSMGKIVKDISSVFSQQKNNFNNIVNAINEQNSETQDVSYKIISTNNLLKNSIELQNSMLRELMKINKNISNLSSDSSNKKDEYSIMKSIADFWGIDKTKQEKMGKRFKRYGGYGRTGLGMLGVLGIAGVLDYFGDELDESGYEKTGGIMKTTGDTLTGATTGNLIGRAFGKRGIGSIVGAGLGAAYGAYDNKDKFTNSKENTNFKGESKEARDAAERYVGRKLSDDEWSKLIRATHAEAGGKNQAEIAMVAASILNRTRDEKTSVGDILTRPKQFQAVEENSQNYVQGPNDKRAEQIYGSFKEILEKIDKNQKDFVSAIPGAYKSPEHANRVIQDRLNKGFFRTGDSYTNTQAPNLQPQSSKQENSFTTEQNKGKVQQLQSEQASVRKLPLNSNLTNILEQAANESGVTVKVTSGGQPAIGSSKGKRIGSTRHDEGNAADLDLYITENGKERKLSDTNPEDKKIMSKFVQKAVSLGATGVGHGHDYMGSSKIHIGFGKPAAWGGSSWIKDAHSEGMDEGGERSTPQRERSKRENVPEEMPMPNDFRAPIGLPMDVMRSLGPLGDFMPLMFNGLTNLINSSQISNVASLVPNKNVDDKIKTIEQAAVEKEYPSKPETGETLTGVNMSNLITQPVLNKETAKAAYNNIGYNNEMDRSLFNPDLFSSIRSAHPSTFKLSFDN